MSKDSEYVAGVGLTPFQVDIARLFFSRALGSTFLLSGGAALLAHNLLTRATKDLDFFTYMGQGDVGPAMDEFERSVVGRGLTLRRLHQSETFGKMIVDGPEALMIDFAVDSPPVRPSASTFVGPTLSPEELATRKLLALFGRAYPRDFADVFILARHFGKAALLKMAAEIDKGFSVMVLADMFHWLNRIADSDLPIADPDLLRLFFQDWKNELEETT